MGDGAWHPAQGSVAHDGPDARRDRHLCVPLCVVAAWAGHADPAFTLRTYAHAQDEAMRDASALMARDFGGAL